MIVLFTDFGLEGPYTGQVKAVLYRTAPGVPVVELFADAPARRPKPAAYLLAAYGIWFPPGAVLLASGAIRCVLGFAYWRQNGWMMLISGVFGLLAGVLILFGFPTISVWALGFLLGVDLISHGLAWLLYALQSVRRTA